MLAIPVASVTAKTIFLFQKLGKFIDRRVLLIFLINTELPVFKTAILTLKLEAYFQVLKNIFYFLNYFSYPPP